VIAHWQLLAHGITARMIELRLKSGRLHRLYRGVYAVGRPDVSDLGRAMAAALACGSTAAICASSGGAMLGMLERAPALIHVSVKAAGPRSHPGLKVHRRRAGPGDEVVDHFGVLLIAPFWTLVALARELGDDELERAINQADFKGVLRVPELCRLAEKHRPHPGTARLAKLIDRRTFTLTDSVLEQRFRRIALQAGLSKPRSRLHLDGFRVDFYFEDLDLVVETDGYGAHRTPAQVTRDAERLQAHAAAGRPVLRFSHAQVYYEADRAISVLRRTADQIQSRRAVVVELTTGSGG